MYPFLGLAIVGLVTVKPLTAVAASPELMVALLIGAALTLAPLAPDRLLPAGRWSGSTPVAVGFILAAYNLWSSGTLVGIGATVILTLLGCTLIVVPWEKVPLASRGVAHWWAADRDGARGPVRLERAEG